MPVPLNDADVAELRTAIAEWRKTADGDSNDNEHEAADNLVSLLEQHVGEVPGEEPEEEPAPKKIRVEWSTTAVTDFVATIDVPAELRTADDVETWIYDGDNPTLIAAEGAPTTDDELVSFIRSTTTWTNA